MQTLANRGRYSKITPQKSIAYVGLAVLVVIVNYPFFWMLASSVKTFQELHRFPPTLFPQAFRWQNYPEAWAAANWPRYFLNSIVISLVVPLGQILFSSLAAYAFTRKFRGSKVVFTLFLGTLMIPSQATLVPNFVIINKLGWINHYPALIVPFLATAFSVFLMRQYFLTIPKDFEDAAVIDGSGPFFYLFRILMPLSGPAMVTVGLFAFMNRWNDYLWALTMTTKDAMRTVQVGLAVYKGEWLTEWGQLMAACTYISIPVIILFLFLQKRFIEGVMMSGVKG